MSLTLLLEKYDVSTDEGLQKALNDIEKEEAEVDVALSGAMSRACLLEGRLRSASQAYVKLGEVKADTEAASDMVDKTANLARDVSAKVRQLDLARSRVAECQMRVNDLIDLQLCSAGVEAAIKAHDYETGAGHVARFLSMDPGSVAAARARGAPDPRLAMAHAADTLRDHLVHKFEEAARKEDDAAVERLFKLFPQIGRADEGVDLLGKYLAAQAEVAIRAASSAGAGAGAAVLDGGRRVARAGAAAAERARRAAPSHLPRAMRHIQPVVCRGMRRVASGARPRTAQDALSAEPAAAELALLHHTMLLYFDLLRRLTQADSASLDEAGQKAAMGEIEKIIAECDLTRAAQDVLGQYLELERFFLEESIDKALRMANSQPGDSTSSLVDDVFFIVNKVIKRGMSTGSVDGACCVLNEAGAGLERAAAALRRALRAPADPLPLPPPPPMSSAPTHAPDPELEAQRALFLAHANEAEAGGEWAERLAEEAARAGVALEGGRGADKVRQCAAGLGAAGAAFRAAHELALRAARAALRPRLVAWGDALAAPAPAPGEVDENEEDADALPAALDALAEAARAALSPRAADALLAAAVHEVADRAEDKMLQHTYDRVGGMCVERRARRLAGWAGGCGARERCARLTQAAALLALDAVAHAPLALQPAPRLAPAHARDLLARRSDFKMEEIKRLKL